MFDHIDLAVVDLEKSRHFYTRVLAALGIEPFIEYDRSDGRKGMGFGRPEGPQFYVGGGSPVQGRLHLAFTARSRLQVDDFYRAALEAGGTPRGEPGLRPKYAEHYYAAFVVDPDGHVVEAVCRWPE